MSISIPCKSAAFCASAFTCVDEQVYRRRLKRGKRERERESLFLSLFHLLRNPSSRRRSTGKARPYFLKLINIPQIRYPGAKENAFRRILPRPLPFPNFDAPRFSVASALGKIPPRELYYSRRDYETPRVS